MLSKRTKNKTKDVTLELPETPDDAHTEATIASQSEAVVAHLATALSSAGTSPS